MRRDWAVVELANISMRVTEKNSQQIDTVFTVSAEHGLIEQEKFFNKRVASKNLIGYTIVRPGSLVYNKSYSANAPLGVITRNVHEYIGVVSPLYIVFKANEEKVLPRFLELATNSAMFHDSLKQFVKEGGRAHGGISVSLGDFFGSELLIPTLTVQKRIVDLVSSFDEYIDALQHQAASARKARNCCLLAVMTGPNPPSANFVMCATVRMIPQNNQKMDIHS
jgi:type I restriction enzyme S subunit